MMKTIKIIMFITFVILISGCGTEPDTSQVIKETSTEEVVINKNSSSSYEIIGTHDLSELNNMKSFKYAHDLKKIYIRQKSTGCLKEITAAHSTFNDGGFIYNEDYVFDNTGKPMCGITREEAKSFFDNSINQ